jgi:hypothetical protein
VSILAGATAIVGLLSAGIAHVRDGQMATDHIRYDILAQEALRGVLRTVLEDAARNGLPGEHHFFITFDTTAEGVILSDRMRAQYPQEMRIVLQHQFWDLTVTDEGFEVGLSFGGIPERLGVPFAAITAFVDPSVEFGLQFQELTEPGEESDAGVPAEPDSSAKAARPPAEHKHKRRATPPPAKDAVSTDAPATDGGDTPSGGGEVVRLDRFRKKK